MSAANETQSKRYGSVFGLPEGVRPPNGWAAVARFGGIGDNLMAASACYGLKKKGYRVEVITSTDSAWQVFCNNPNIDKLSIKTKSEMPEGGEPWQKWFRGRQDEYDVFAHLSHSCENQLAFFPGSTAFNWPAAVRRQIANKSYIEFVHDIAGVPYEFGQLFYPTDEENKQAIETKEKIGPVCVGWCISGSRIDKIHPYSPLAIARIIKELNTPVVMIGSQGHDLDRAKLIQEQVTRTNGSGDGLHCAMSLKADADGTISNNWPLRRTLTFAQHCDVIVGPDTGTMWAVAFEDMAKVVLLSHASSENLTKHWVNTNTLQADKTRVPCHPCHRLHDSPDTCVANKEGNGAACISDISVEDIVSSVKAAL